MECGMMSVWMSCDAHYEPCKNPWTTQQSVWMRKRMGMSAYVFQLIIFIIMFVVCKMGLVFWIAVVVVVRLKIFHFNHRSDNVFDFWLFSLSANNEKARGLKQKIYIKDFFYSQSQIPKHTYAHWTLNILNKEKSQLHLHAICWKDFLSIKRRSFNLSIIIISIHMRMKCIYFEYLHSAFCMHIAYICKQWIIYYSKK